ncbi:MAG: hypothetical protein ACU85E_06685 [Gammaproteobacteria bacterium]
MSEDVLITERRRFQIEEAILILLLILSLTGIAITEYAPADGYGYWLIMVFVFALSAMFIAWLQSKQRAGEVKAILRDQSLHWGTSMLIVGAAFLIQHSGRIDSTSAGIMISLILSLSTILDGIRVGWRFSMVGFYLGISAVFASFFQHSIWIEILIAATIISGTIVWEIWQYRRTRAQP